MTLTNNAHNTIKLFNGIYYVVHNEKHFVNTSTAQCCLQVVLRAVVSVCNLVYPQSTVFWSREHYFKDSVISYCSFRIISSACAE